MIYSLFLRTASGEEMVQRKLFFATLLLLLIAGSSYAAPCPAAKRQIYLAAVTGESTGETFQLTVETRPGSGLVYTVVNPRTGFMTQESEETAADYAFANSGYARGECDVLFTISGVDGTVDGPSAGAAMAVATHAALLGKRVRQDIVMTGTVSQEGRIGEVGSIIEKAIAAADADAKYFLSPKLQVHEALLISAVAKGRDFQAIETLSVPEAEKIAFSDYSAEFYQNYTPKSAPLPEDLQEQKLDADMARFSLVAGRVVEKLEGKVDSIFGQDGSLPQISGLHDYFKEEIAKEKRQISLGYPFTAANAAFLLSIDAEYLKIGGNKLDMKGSRQDVEACVKRLPKAQKTKENWEWALGADLRRSWAEKKLNDTSDALRQEDDYSRLRDLLFAYSWCGVSEELSAQAQDLGGRSIDEPLLSPLAARKIADAEAEIESAARPDYDAFWHLEAAKLSQGKGDFGAAIYDATYAKVMQEVAGENVENMTGAAQKLIAEKRRSLWGKVYSSQGFYLYQESLEGKFQPADAYRVLRYSQELDRAAEEVEQALASKRDNGTGSDVQGETRNDDEAVALLLAASVSALGLLAAYRASRET